MALPYLDELKKCAQFNRCETYRRVDLQMRINDVNIRVEENWLRSMGWSNRVYYIVQVRGRRCDRWRYNLETVQNMKEMCKQNGIKGYSKLRSRELASCLMSI